MNATTTWVCWGSIRGWCGHEHDSWTSAIACCGADSIDCVMATNGRGGSDRGIYRPDELSRRADGDYYQRSGTGYQS